MLFTATVLAAVVGFAGAQFATKTLVLTGTGFVAGQTNITTVTQTSMVTNTVMSAPMVQAPSTGGPLLPVGDIFFKTFENGSIDLKEIELKFGKNEPDRYIQVSGGDDVETPLAVVVFVSGVLALALLL